MADNEPDFSFLNDDQKSDSAILEKKRKESEDENPEATTEDDNSQQPDSSPSWMKDPAREEPQDSGTRFASSLEPDDSPSEEAKEASGNEPEAEAENATSDETAERSDSEENLEEQKEKPQAEEESESVRQEESAAEVSQAESAAEDQEESAGVESSEEAVATTTRPEKKPKASKKRSSSGKSKKSDQASEPATGKDQVTVSRQHLTILVSYASAITLICIYLIIQSFSAKPHELESLPDIKPPMNEDDEIAYQLVPESAELPRGHTMTLGESTRFGNLLVTPLRVEKEPLQFEHYSGNSEQKREQTGKVLKLWVKFENVSEGQVFAPLDRKLILKRIVDPDNPAQLRSNQFLVAAGEKGNLEETHLLYDLEEFGNWNFAGIKDRPVLKPGETVEMYLPSSEAAAENLEGTALWRIQFRKGYHPESKRGVTTLIEVKFNTSEIENV